MKFLFSHHPLQPLQLLALNPFLSTSHLFNDTFLHARPHHYISSVYVMILQHSEPLLHKNLYLLLLTQYPESHTELYDRGGQEFC